MLLGPHKNLLTVPGKGNIERYKRVVSYSSGKYHVNEDLMSVTELLTSEIIYPYIDKTTGEYVIDIDHPYLSKPVKFGLVLMLTGYNPLIIPKYLKYLGFKYLDGNKLNCTLDNLQWDFGKGIESEEFPGFYYIPGFSQYVINRKGIIINVIDGYLPGLGLGRENKRYPGLRLTKDNGSSWAGGLHSIIALVFCEFEGNVNNLVVNHIDHDRSNFSVENLEWVTSQENSLKANLFYKRGICHEGRLSKESYNNIMENTPPMTTSKGLDIKRKIKALNFRTKEIKHFISGLECSKFFEVSAGAVSVALRHGKVPRVIKRDWIIVHMDEDFPKISNSFIERRMSSYSMPVLSKNVITGEIKGYSSGSEFSRISKISRKRVFTSLSKRLQKRYGDLIFKYEVDKAPWRL